MHPFQRYILANNNTDWASFTPLRLAGLALGMVHRDVAAMLLQAGLLQQAEGFLLLAREENSVEGRTRQLREILLILIEKKLVKRDRHELYPVTTDFDAPHVALADRALMPALGFRSRGIHCNATVGSKLWVARRALDSATDPGKFDHLVAGGQPFGLSLRENLAKEAFEEAGVPPELLKAAKDAGTVTYSRQQGHTLRRDTLYLFDLELPASFTPKNQDGEVLDFRLMEIEEVKKLLLEGDHFKFNVPLVLIDFLMRRGLIEADPALQKGLHAPHSPGK